MPPHPAVAELRSALRPVLTGAPRGVLVACSGGADSLALAAALAFEAPRRGVAAGLVTVDHGLLPGSARQARRVAALGYELGMDPVVLVPVDVGTAGGPEAAARAARYAALEAVAESLDRDVLLAHTLDDQAETVLLGLGRGSGPRSIAGMRPRSGRWLRPLLGVRRRTTRAACEALGLTPWEDPSNDDRRLQRVRLRQEVLPLLEDVLRGGVAEALARTATLVREDLDALDRAVPDVSGTDRELAVAGLADLPRGLRTRALRSWAGGVGAGPLSSVHLDALDALLTRWRGQGPVDLPGGVRVLRRSGTLVAQRHRAAGQSDDGIDEAVAE